MKTSAPYTVGKWRSSKRLLARLDRLPQRLECLEVEIRDGMTLFRRALLQFPEACFEFPVGRTQGGFRIKSQMAGQVDQREQEVSELLLHRRLVAAGHGLAEFTQLFVQ